MLRDVTKLETIVNILTYLNGSANCREDDIISEARLYVYVCNILDVVDYETILSEGGSDRLIEKEISDYVEPFPGARQRLENGIRLILTYYAAALVKVRAEQDYQAVMGRESPERAEIGNSE